MLITIICIDGKFEKNINELKSDYWDAFIKFYEEGTPLIYNSNFSQLETKFVICNNTDTSNISEINALNIFIFAHEIQNNISMDCIMKYIKEKDISLSSNTRLKFKQIAEKINDRYSKLILDAVNVIELNEYYLCKMIGLF